MRHTKYLSTCDHCRAWKVRCSKVNEQDEACVACTKRGLQCKFSPTKVRKPYAPRIVKTGKARVPEEVRDNVNEADSSPSWSTDAGTFASATQFAPSIQDVTPLRPSLKEPRLYVDSLLFNPDSIGSPQEEMLRYAVGGLSVSRQITEDHVPSSSLAFFSDDAVANLSRKLGHDKLKDLVEALEVTMKARWIAAVQHKEPPEDWVSCPERQSQYIQSYFEHVHPIFPFLDQAEFERRASSSEKEMSESNQNTWSALYNTILGLGCMYHDGGSFQPAHGQAWNYFKVSFDHFKDVLTSTASLLKAQAMTAMAVFALNYSSLQIETLCISEAARTIITLSLHKKLLDPQSNEDSRRIFWVVYCVEKEYAFNSSHASLIADLDISCPLPKIPVVANEGFDWLWCWARYSRILSRAYDTLFSTSATLNSADAHFSYMECIMEDLEAWKNSIPDDLRPGSPLRQHRMRRPHMQDLALRIHFSYFNLQICISRLALHLCVDQSSRRGSESKKCLLLAARYVIESTPYIPMEPYTPVFILGTMPMVAMFIIFDFVIKNPLHPETRTNLSFLDIVTAHFARLDLASKGTLHDTKVAEFTSIARLYVESFTKDKANGNSRATPNAPSNMSQRLTSESDITLQQATFSTQQSSNDVLGSCSTDMIYDLDDKDFSASADFNVLDFPDAGSSLYMSLPQSGYDIASLFNYPVI